MKTEGLTPQELREALAERLRQECRWDLVNVLVKCSELVRLECMCCRAAVIVDRGCSKRWCPVCAPAITARRYARVSRLVPRFKWPMAVTFTRENTHKDTGFIAEFKDDFRKFRRTDFWADRVKGGVVGFEVTNKGKGYHTHLHALVDCRWLAVATPEPVRWMSKRQKESLCKRAQKELSAVWGAYVQGRKAQVWVERAWGKALAETLKYAIKPSDLINAKCSASSIIDAIDEGRMMSTFGHAHACSKEFVGLEDEIERERTCRDCDSDRSILPEQTIARMIADPRRLSPHWRRRIQERFERMGMHEAEVANALDIKGAPTLTEINQGQYWDDDEE